MTAEHEGLLTSYEVDKVKAKYEGQAAAKQRSKGFWGGLGDRSLGGIDFLTSKIDW